MFAGINLRITRILIAFLQSFRGTYGHFNCDVS